MSKMIIGVVAAGVIAGVGGYYVGKSSAPTITTTATETRTITKTIATSIGTPATTTITSPISKSRVTWMCWETATEHIVREFIKTVVPKYYPELDVNLIIMDWAEYHKTLLTQLASGEAPDLMAADTPYMDYYLDHGLLLPLNDLVGEDFLKKFYPFLLERSTRDSKVYAVPPGWAQVRLFYNLDLFKKAGLSDPPSTFEELYEYAKIITEKTGVPGVMAYDLGTFHYFSAYVEAWGAPHFTARSPEDAEYFDRPEVIECLKFVYDKYQEGRTKRLEEGKTPYIAYPQDVGASFDGEAFAAQKVAMILSGGWNYSYWQKEFPNFKYKVNWAQAPFPAGPKKRVTEAFCGMYAVPKFAKNIEGGAKLLKLVTSEEGQRRFIMPQGMLPSIPELEEECNPFQKEALSFIKQYDHITHNCYGPKTPEIQRKASEILHAAFTGQLSFEDMLKQLKDVVVSAFR